MEKLKTYRDVPLVKILAGIRRCGKSTILDMLLDEVQEINGWEKAVNSQPENANTDIYVTGSNSRLMSGEISTYLTGRYISIPVYTLSFAEYLDFKKSDSRSPKEMYIVENVGIQPRTRLRQFPQRRCILWKMWARPFPPTPLQSSSKAGAFPVCGGSLQLSGLAGKGVCDLSLPAV